MAILALVLLADCGRPSEADAPAEEPDEPPRAADFRSSRVQEALDAASDIAQTRGFAGLGDAQRGFLVDHDSDVREQPMRAGTCYLALGAASAAMRELDLRVFDSDGGQVVQDGTSGPTAALRFCPSQSGTYYIAVRASAGSGLYEIRTFRGPTGLDVRMDDLFREVATPEPPREPR